MLICHNLTSIGTLMKNRTSDFSFFVLKKREISNLLFGVKKIGMSRLPYIKMNLLTFSNTHIILKHFSCHIIKVSERSERAVGIEGGQVRWRCLTTISSQLDGLNPAKNCLGTLLAVYSN